MGGLITETWDLLVYLWARGSWALSFLIEWSLAIAIGYPIAIVFLSLAGMHQVTGIVAIGAPIVGFLLLASAGFRLYRLQLMGVLEVAGVAALTSEHARRSLKRLLQWLALVLFLELSFGMYFTVIPVENARGRIIWVVGAGILLLLARALPAGKLRKRASTVLAIFLIGTTVAFYPGARKAVHKATSGPSRAEAALAGAARSYSVCPGEPESYNFGSGVTRLTVRSQPQCWTGWVVTPAGSAFRIDAAPLGGTIQVLFLDGTAVAIEEGKPTDLGVRRGIFRIRSQAGAEKATVTVS